MKPKILAVTLHAFTAQFKMQVSILANYVKDVSVYLGEGGGVSARKMRLRPYLLVSTPSAGVLNIFPC